MVQVARQGLVVRPERPSHHCDALEVRTGRDGLPIPSSCGTSSPILFGRVYMWMRPSWDSQYTRTETERAKTPY